MKGNKHMKTITNITYLAFALCAIACFALSPSAQAQCQEGCNLNGGATTVLGDAALVNNTEGNSNTADGMEALFYNLTGGGNTATGYLALFENIGDNNTANGVN